MPRVLIVGGGFAGLAAAERLARPAATGELEVTLADRRSAQQFLPLLPDLVGRDIPPEHVQYPLAGAARRFGFRFVPEAVGFLDPAGRVAVTAAGTELRFDFLLVAAGAETDFHGRDDLRERSLTLHSVEDVLRLRSAVGELRIETFVVAGGGYTGIEAATNIWRATLGRRPAPRIVVVELAPVLCATLPGPLREYIDRNVRSLGIEVRTSSSIAAVSGEALTLTSGESFGNSQLIWTAGVRAPEFVAALPVGKTPGGRLKVDGFLGFADGCFAAGDAAAFDRDGAPLRMSVQFSRSGGAAAAENVLRAARGRPPRRFRPFDPGYLVPMANGRAGGLVAGVPVRGRLGALLHYGMCLLRLRGGRQRRGLFRSLVRRPSRPMPRKPEAGS